MNKFIKPMDLPEGFWGECFVSIFDEIGIFTEINHVKKINKVAFWYSGTEQEWFSFRPDIEVRIMEVEYPKITEEDFK